MGSGSEKQPLENLPPLVNDWEDCGISAMAGTAMGKEVEKGLPVIWPLVAEFRQSWELNAKVISQRPGMQKATAACGAICLPIEQQ